MDKKAIIDHVRKTYRFSERRLPSGGWDFWDEDELEQQQKVSEYNQKKELVLKDYLEKLCGVDKFSVAARDALWERVCNQAKKNYDPQVYYNNRTKNESIEERQHLSVLIAESFFELFEFIQLFLT